MLRSSAAVVDYQPPAPRDICELLSTVDVFHPKSRSKEQPLNEIKPGPNGDASQTTVKAKAPSRRSSLASAAHRLRYISIWFSVHAPTKTPEPIARDGDDGKRSLIKTKRHVHFDDNAGGSELCMSSGSISSASASRTSSASTTIAADFDGLKALPSSRSSSVSSQCTSSLEPQTRPSGASLTKTRAPLSSAIAHSRSTMQLVHRTELATQTSTSMPSLIEAMFRDVSDLVVVAHVMRLPRDRSSIGAATSPSLFHAHLIERHTRYAHTVKSAMDDASSSTETMASNINTRTSSLRNSLLWSLRDEGMRSGECAGVSSGFTGPPQHAVIGLWEMVCVLHGCTTFRFKFHFFATHSQRIHRSSSGFIYAARFCLQMRGHDRCRVCEMCHRVFRPMEALNVVFCISTSIPWMATSYTLHFAKSNSHRKAFLQLEQLPDADTATPTKCNFKQYVRYFQTWLHSLLRQRNLFGRVAVAHNVQHLPVAYLMPVFRRAMTHVLVAYAHCTHVHGHALAKEDYAMMQRSVVFALVWRLIEAPKERQVIASGFVSGSGAKSEELDSELRSLVLATQVPTSAIVTTE